MLHTSLSEIEEKQLSSTFEALLHQHDKRAQERYINSLLDCLTDNVPFGSQDLDTLMHTL